jgi:ferrous iron transport protein B
MKTILVPLAGNPNVGKTTLLNQMAGSNLRVGNWSGVTIEKKEAFARYGDFLIHFVDLPGIYTLDPVSEAEQVAVKFLTEGKVDVILNVVDATNLPRNLSLTTEVIEFGTPTVIALNMIDEASEKGIEVDEVGFSELLGVKAVKTNGRTGSGIKRLLGSIVEAYTTRSVPKPPTYSQEFEKVLGAISLALKNGEAPTKRDVIRALADDPRFSREREELEGYFGKELSEILDDERWGFSNGLGKQLVRRERKNSRELTERLDALLLHPYLGIPIYLFIFYMVFKVSFDFSSPYMDWIDSFLNDLIAPSISLLLSGIGAPIWIGRFFSEALVGGVGFVLTFIPLIATIFFFITLLEMSGYLPRIAFIMDRFMHKMGLHGNMITPLLLGFGCNVPAIMATRTMTSRRDKFLVIMMIPFMACPARLVVFAFFAVTFFDNPALVIAALYAIGMVVAVFTALILRRSIFKGRLEHFVLELPPYRAPSLKTVGRIVWAHVKSFLRRAGTAIFLVTVLVWFLLNLPPGVSDPGRSIAGYAGRALTPLFEPIGLTDWRAPTSLIPSFLAREIVLSTMGTIYRATDPQNGAAGKDFSIGEAGKRQLISLGKAAKDSVTSLFSLLPRTFEVEEEALRQDTLREKIKGSFTTLSAFSFMILLLIYNSCVATVSTMTREVGKGYALLFLAYSFIAAWLLAFVVYNACSLLL